MTDAREALVAHLERTGMGYGLHDGLKREVLGAWADAILAEFDLTPRGERVKPSLEQVVDALAAQPPGRGEWTSSRIMQTARAVLALLPGRSEAEVKAEALREAQDELVRRDAFTERSLRVLDELIEKGEGRG